MKNCQNLTQDNDKYDANDDFEERLEFVEEMTKVKTLRSCEELARHGIAKSGMYQIDPDGELISNDPIRVNCIFKNGQAITEISHYQEKTIVVDNCDGIGCFKQEINYEVPIGQMEALISLSETCEQSVSYGCFLAPLISVNETLLGGWNDRLGNLLTFLVSITYLTFLYITMFYRKS